MLLGPAVTVAEYFELVWLGWDVCYHATTWLGAGGSASGSVGGSGQVKVLANVRATILMGVVISGVSSVCVQNDG